MGFAPGALEITFLEGALVGAAIHLGGALWYTRRQRISFESATDAKLQGAEARITGKVLEDAGQLRAQVLEQVSSMRAAVLEQVGQLRAQVLEQLGGTREDLERSLESVRDDVQEHGLKVASELFSKIDTELVPKIQGSIGGQISAEVRAARKEGLLRGASPEDKVQLAEMQDALGKKQGTQVFVGLKIVDRWRARRQQKRLPQDTTSRTVDQPTAPAPVGPAGPIQLKQPIIDALERAGFVRAPTDGQDEEETPDDAATGPDRPKAPAVAGD